MAPDGRSERARRQEPGYASRVDIREAGPHPARMRCTSSVASTARRFSSLSALLLTLLVASCSDGPAPLVVPTTEGDVQGTLAEDLRIFLGIPYAAPPTGALRFLPPAAPAARTETLVAEQYGPSCPGTRSMPC